jgi:predicted phage terminase large subunit-like protein
MSARNLCSDQQTLDAILRSDFTAFIAKVFATVVGGDFQPNWHVDAMAHVLTGCLEGQARRLAICLPPRHLKSITASVAFPAWILGHHPMAKIICVSYSKELSGGLADACRKVMASEWYRKLFPGTRLSRGGNADGLITTTAGGQRVATSVGGTLTGLGGEFLIVDDIIKAGDANSDPTRTGANKWFDDTLLSRLNNPNKDCIVVVGQRLHVDDIFGHVLEKQPERWSKLLLPLIAERDEEIPIGPGLVHHRRASELLQPSRLSRNKAEELKASMREANFAAQYQQNPTPPGGNLIRRDWLKVYPCDPDRADFEMIVQSWDTASSTRDTADFSVCTTWGVREHQYYLLDVVRARLDYPALKQRVIAEYDRHRPHRLLIENADLGRALISDLRAQGIIRPIGIHPVQDKLTRAEAQSDRISSGRVHLPEESPWREEFMNEILSFPNGRHDDQIDSMTQFLKWISDMEAMHARSQQRRDPVRQPGRYHNLGQARLVGGLGALRDSFR